MKRLHIASSQSHGAILLLALIAASCAPQSGNPCGDGGCPDTGPTGCGPTSCGSAAQCVTWEGTGYFQCSNNCASSSDCPVSHCCQRLTNGTHACAPSSDYCPSVGQDAGTGGSCHDRRSCVAVSSTASSSCGYPGDFTLSATNNCAQAVEFCWGTDLSGGHTGTGGCMSIAPGASYSVDWCSDTGAYCWKAADYTDPTGCALTPTGCAP